jgi:hypothetical protein
MVGMPSPVVHIVHDMTAISTHCPLLYIKWHKNYRWGMEYKLLECHCLICIMSWLLPSIHIAPWHHMRIELPLVEWKWCWSELYGGDCHCKCCLIKSSARQNPRLGSWWYQWAWTCQMCTHSCAMSWASQARDGIQCCNCPGKHHKLLTDCAHIVPSSG